MTLRSRRKMFERGDGLQVGWFKPKDGENLLRVFTFEHEVKERDLKLGRYLEGEVEVGDKTEELFVSYRKHFKPTIDMCGLIRNAENKLVGNCSRCEAAREMMNSDDPDERKAAARHRANDQFCLIVVDLEREPYEYQLWNAPTTVTDFLDSAIDSRKWKKKSPFGLHGRDLLVTYDKQSPPAKRYSVEWMDPDDNTDMSDASIDGEIHDLMDLRRFVHPDFHGYWSDDEKKEDPDPEEEGPTLRKAKKAPVKRAEPDEDDEEEEEEVEEKKPRGRKKSPRKRAKEVGADKDHAEKYAPGMTVTFSDEDGTQMSGVLLKKDGESWDVEIEEGGQKFTWEVAESEMTVEE